jgi:predicted component of type VI protein secretion system
MKNREQHHSNHTLSVDDKFEALRDFIEAEFAQGVCAADALVAVRKRAAELGVTKGMTPGAEKLPRIRLVIER